VDRARELFEYERHLERVCRAHDELKKKSQNGLVALQERTDVCRLGLANLDVTLKHL
jgi:hypothetical protein